MIDPADDELLDPATVAEWLDVTPDWVEQTARAEGLPIMGRTSAGDPIVLAGEVRAWLRRPDPHGDTT